MKQCYFSYLLKAHPQFCFKVSDHPLRTNNSSYRLIEFAVQAQIKKIQP